MSDEHKSKESSTDSELDELLNNALKDFNQPPKPNTSNDDSAAASVEDTVEDATWPQDFIKQTAQQLENNIHSILTAPEENLAGSFQEMMQNVAAAISGSSEGQNSQFGAAIAQVVKDINATAGNLQNSAGGFTEGELTDKFFQKSLDDTANDMNSIFPIMQGMMQSLLSKEILYPSLKELVDKYPEWLDENKATLPSKDFERFNKQLNLMQNVCSELEIEKDDDTDDVKKQRFDKILSLMHEMQGFGQPPKELVG